MIYVTNVERNVSGTDVASVLVLRVFSHFFYWQLNSLAHHLRKYKKKEKYITRLLLLSRDCIVHLKMSYLKMLPSLIGFML